MLRPRVANLAGQAAQMSLHELREVRRVGEAEIGGDPGDRAIGVGEESMDLQRNSFVENLFGCLVRDQLAGTIEGASAVAEVAGEFAAAGPFVQPFLDDPPKVDIGRR